MTSVGPSKMPCVGQRSGLGLTARRVISDPISVQGSCDESTNNNVFQSNKVNKVLKYKCS